MSEAASVHGAYFGCDEMEDGTFKLADRPLCFSPNADMADMMLVDANYSAEQPDMHRPMTGVGQFVLEGLTAAAAARKALFVGDRSAAVVELYDRALGTLSMPSQRAIVAAEAAQLLTLRAVQTGSPHRRHESRDAVVNIERFSKHAIEAAYEADDLTETDEFIARVHQHAAVAQLTIPGGSKPAALKEIALGLIRLRGSDTEDSNRGRTPSVSIKSLLRTGAQAFVSQERRHRSVAELLDYGRAMKL